MHSHGGAARSSHDAPALRYLTDLLVQSRHDSVYLWETFTVNVFGSALLGGVAGGVAVIMSAPRTS